MFSYDANGNRETANGDTYSTGEDNEISSDGTYAYTYDHEGNRIAKFIDGNINGVLDSGDTNVTTYEWDNRNRLVEVICRATYGGTPTQIVQYGYDAYNQLVRKVFADATEDLTEVFVHDGGQIVLDFADDELGDLSAADLAHRYLWGTKVDELLAEETVDDGSSDDVGWTFTDHQGSVRAVARYDSATDATTVTKQIVYDAYGNVASTSGTDATTPLFLYTGRLYDSATQLQNNLNRWYDAAVGRWLSEDPIGFDGDPGNLYRYCGNGPVNWVDPSGLEMILISDACPVGPVYFGGSGGDGDTVAPAPEDKTPDWQLDLAKPSEETFADVPGRFRQPEPEWDFSTPSVTLLPSPLREGPPPEYSAILPLPEGYNPDENGRWEHNGIHYYYTQELVALPPEPSIATYVDSGLTVLGVGPALKVATTVPTKLWALGKYALKEIGERVWENETGLPLVNPSKVLRKPGTGLGALDDIPRRKKEEIIDDITKSKRRYDNTLKAGAEGLETAENQIDDIWESQRKRRRRQNSFDNDPDTWDDNEPPIRDVNTR